MKVVLIGGSSPSTPALFESLGDTTVAEVVLLGRAAASVAAVTRAARLLAPPGVRVTPAALGEPGWEEAFGAADVTVLQIRPGGHGGRAYCETFPPRYGVPGDQALGPGGLAAAWWGWPEVRRYLRLVESHAPGSALVILTAPVGVFTRLALTAAPSLRVFGVCELPWTVLRQVAGAAGVPAGEIDFDYFGVNHLGWFHRLTARGRDLVDEYHGFGLDSSHGVNPPPGFRAIPTPYWRLHFTRRADPTATASRTAFLAELRTRALRVFETGAPADVRAVLGERPAPWYPEALAPLLRALGGRSPGVPLFLTTRQAGWVPHLPPEAALEIPHAVKDGVLAPRPLAVPVPPGIRELVAGFVRFEQVAAEVVASGDPGRLAAALAAHPWTLPGTDTDAMAAEIDAKGMR